MNYPDKFIRGISSEDYVDTAGRASAALFQFIDSNRSDDYSESSINWYDDEGALALIMEQRKEKDETQYQFKCGAAIIEKKDADRIMTLPAYQSVFGYERSPIAGNKYHGNLLRKDKALSKGIQTVIAANLVMDAQIIFRSTV
jgi:hypothetical protein